MFKMIKSLVRPAVVFLCLFVIVESFVLWNATNRDPFTRYHDAERAERDSNDQGLTDLFGDSSSAAESAATSALPSVPNQFRLGLLPSTYPWMILDKHLVSVLTLAGPAAFVIVLTLGAPLLDRPKKAPPADSA